MQDIKDVDRAFYGKITEQIGGYPLRIHTFGDDSDVEFYDSGLLLRKEKKKFQVTRRVLSRIPGELPLDSIEHYRKRAKQAPSGRARTRTWASDSISASHG